MQRTDRKCNILFCLGQLHRKLLYVYVQVHHIIEKGIESKHECKVSECHSNGD